MDTNLQLRALRIAVQAVRVQVKPPKQESACAHILYQKMIP